MEYLNKPEVYIPIIVSIITNLLLGGLRWSLYLLYGLFWFVRLNILWYLDDRIGKSPDYMQFKEVTYQEELRREKKARKRIYWKYMNDRIKEELKKMKEYLS